ncbi:MAG: hypothetical protein NT069_25535 [Planctomycetota bacterium]|nr:hypothetical protein [Planctomycetota bacterium]
MLQIHFLQKGHEELSRRLLPDGDRVIIYRQPHCQPRRPTRQPPGPPDGQRSDR